MAKALPRRTLIYAALLVTLTVAGGATYWLATARDRRTMRGLAEINRSYDSVFEKLKAARANRIERD